LKVALNTINQTNKHFNIVQVVPLDMIYWALLCPCDYYEAGVFDWFFSLTFVREENSFHHNMKNVLMKCCEEYPVFVFTNIKK
jgi:hypothetical protein